MSHFTFHQDIQIYFINKLCSFIAMINMTSSSRQFHFRTFVYSGKCVFEQTKNYACQTRFREIQSTATSPRESLNDFSMKFGRNPCILVLFSPSLTQDLIAEASRNDGNLLATRHSGARTHSLLNPRRCNCFVDLRFYGESAVGYPFQISFFNSAVLSLRLM